MEKNNFSKNFQRIVNERNLSLLEVSRMAELSIETIKNIYYQKIKNPKIKTVIAIANGLNVSTDLLVKGKECEENELLALYECCSEKEKKRILRISQILADITELNIKTKKNYIPYIIPIKDFSSINILAIDTNNTNALFAIETRNSKLFPNEFNERILLFDNKIPKEN